MAIPTSNYPLTFAHTTNGVIHLYVVVYSSNNGVTFPSDPPKNGQKKTYDIATSGSGTVPQFMHYQFDKSDIDTIIINCDNHIRKILVEDFEETTAPTLSGHKALDVPYCFTKKSSLDDPNRFDVEVILFAGTPQKFKITHNELAGTDTESVISTDGANNVSEILGSRTFNVTNFMATEGAHTAYLSGGTKKSRTKNKYHSPTPFPGDKKSDTIKPGKKINTLATQKQAKPKSDKP